MISPPRQGQSLPKLTREQFRQRFYQGYVDPTFNAVSQALAEVEEVAWHNYHEGRKAPLTEPAGAGYADPTYKLSVEWKASRQRLVVAEERQKAINTPSRVLLICGSARNDGSCPGEISKTWRLTQMAQEELLKLGIEVDILDLSLITSNYDQHIHPCKACVSTAMPLCHWPCSCYPNPAYRQTHDWMAEIYERWVAAHGVIILTPVYWYQTPSVLKLMIDRLVCADGGNPDPTTTQGKDAIKAKAMELAGWHYPKHLAGRAYGVVVHGDVEGAEGVRRGLCDWLDSMGLIAGGPSSRLDRYIGYFQPYATSHEDLDRDQAMQQEVRNVAKTVAQTVLGIRQGTIAQPDKELLSPRPK